MTFMDNLSDEILEDFNESVTENGAVGYRVSKYQVGDIVHVLPFDQIEQRHGKYNPNTYYNIAKSTINSMAEREEGFTISIVDNYAGEITYKLKEAPYWVWEGMLVNEENADMDGDISCIKLMFDDFEGDEVTIKNE